MHYTSLPTDIVKSIHRFYFPCVMQELLEKKSENNQFIVRSSRISGSSITEFDTLQFVYYLTAPQTTRYYRSGTRAEACELIQAHTSDQENKFPRVGGYVTRTVCQMRRARE